MTDTRKKDIDWIIRTYPDRTSTTSEAQLAVLMDLRDELQQLNALLHCVNFTGIPAILRKIAKNTTKKGRRP